MKKYVQNFWVRFLACILCTVSVIGTVLAGGALIGYAMVDDWDEVYEQGRELIAENYAAYLYETVTENTEEDIEQILDKFFEKSNFTCEITLLSDLDKETEEDEIEKESKVLYSNFIDAYGSEYIFAFRQAMYVHYKINSVWDALCIQDTLVDDVYMAETAILRYVFDTNTGMFYYETESGYFPVDYIFIWQKNGENCDYKLQKEGDNYIYYNGYYDLTLDASAYQEWNYVEFDDRRMPLSVDGNGDVINIVNDTEKIEGNLYTDIFYVDYGHEGIISYYKQEVLDTYTVMINVPKSVQATGFVDLFYEWEDLYKEIRIWESRLMPFLIVFLFLFVLSFILLVVSAKSEKETLGFWNKIPICIFSVGMFLLELPFYVFAWDVLYGGFAGYGMLPMNLLFPLSIGTASIMVLIVVLWLQNMITRFKTKTFWRYSEFYYVSRPMVFTWNLAQENLSLFGGGIAVLLVIGVIELIGIVVCVGIWWEPVFLIALFVIGKCIQIPLVIYLLFQMKQLQDGAKRVASGNLSEPIDTGKMVWAFKKHGEYINQVSEGIGIAVEEQLKSERFKTELITNVSHDIKTPLTSIINYVDLIKKEEITNPTLCEYVDVLDRQSARLKKLIEDLMEASKASTGNLKVEQEECDVEVLLTQVIGEFEEKLQANALEVVVEKPDCPVLITADGRHMWRVLDNLLNNACKYSLPNTRVYITLQQDTRNVIIIFKNISKSQLNIDSDELMERFVRGDSSRNTEGSGLGLSIAQSLTELMNGTMKLEIDGDLFKVTLKFDAIADTLE